MLILSWKWSRWNEKKRLINVYAFSFFIQSSPVCRKHHQIQKVHGNSYGSKHHNQALHQVKLRVRQNSRITQTGENDKANLNQLNRAIFPLKNLTQLLPSSLSPGRFLSSISFRQFALVEDTIPVLFDVFTLEQKRKCLAILQFMLF